MRKRLKIDGRDCKKPEVRLGKNSGFDFRFQNLYLQSVLDFDFNSREIRILRFVRRYFSHHSELEMGF